MKQQSQKGLPQTYTIKNWTKLLHEQSQSYEPFIQDLFIHPAYGKTHVVANQLFPNYSIIHFDEKGKKLGSLRFSCNDYFQIEMLTDQDVLILKGNDEYNELISYQFTIWNLRSHKKIQFPHFCHDKKQEHSGVQLFVFKQTKMFCVCQTIYRSTYKKSEAIPEEFMLSYYQYKKGKQAEEYRACHVFGHRLDNNLECQRRPKAIKINQISKVGFINQEDNNNDFLQVKIYDLNSTNNRRGKIESYKFEHDLQQQLPLCSIIATQLWELEPNVYYIKLETELNFVNYIIKSQPNLEDQYQQIYSQFQFIWRPEFSSYRSLKLNGKQQYSQSQFINFPRELKNFSRGIPFKNPKNIKERKFQNSQLKIVQYPIYLISIFKGAQVISGRIDTTGTSGRNRKLHPIFNGKSVVIYEMEEEGLKVNVQFLENIHFQQTTAITFLTLGMIKNCDHDLLEIIVELIKQGQKQ